jgi:hypothetical protein
MSEKQSNGRPRYASGALVPPDELDMVAQAFGFQSARHLDQVCDQADRKRAARAHWPAVAS